MSLGQIALVVIERPKQTPFLLILPDTDTARYSPHHAPIRKERAAVTEPEELRALYRIGEGPRYERNKEHRPGMASNKLSQQVVMREERLYFVSADWSNAAAK